MEFLRLSVYFASLLVGVWGQTNASWLNTAPPFGSEAHPLEPTARWGSFSAPLPTNSFFTNLVLGNGEFPIVPLPYMTKITSNSIEISSPGLSSTSSYVISSFLRNMEMGATEDLQQHVIDAFDPLSVTVRWDSQEGEGSLKTPIVRGSPYVTAIYDNLTPFLSTAHAILQFNGNGEESHSGSKFDVHLNNGQRWNIFVLGGSEITFTQDGNTLTASNPFTGSIRVALVPSEEDQEIIDKCAETVPIGSQVSHRFCNDSATITFEWKVEGPPESLLLMALPHHMEMLVSDNEQTLAGKFRTIKGKMTGLVGNIWELGESLTPIGWSSDLDNIDDSERDAILAALAEDKSLGTHASDPYFGGKQMAAMARLAIIADDMEDFETATEIRQNLKRILGQWLNGSNSNPLVYDSSWGGIVSTNGMRDSGADFGNGWYNDHHFHYGYHIYAAAAIAKTEPEWVKDRLGAVMSLVRDYASPSADSYFPHARHKDWYDGHSWASGLYPFGDSKNQESSSESANGYYAVYLLGKSLGDDELRDYGRLLLATEMRSVRRYWQMYEDSDIYEPVFAANRVVGVLWSSKVDYTTWFGNQVELIHCIQMMPFTPITEELLPVEWVEEEYPILVHALNRTETPINQGWRGYVYMDHAIIDPQAAWEEVNSLTGYDDGNTKTNTLYWVASRPDPEKLKGRTDPKVIQCPKLEE